VKFRVPSNDDGDRSGHRFFDIKRSQSRLEARFCAGSGEKDRNSEFLKTHSELTHLARPAVCFSAHATTNRASIGIGVYGRRGSG